VEDFSDWVDTTWYEPVGLPDDVGARLGAEDFVGFPFEGFCGVPQRGVETTFFL